ncbi:hypothetical protein D3C76_928680 [compost metagenome]
MHQHHGLEVVDPEVIVLAIAQRVNGAQGLFLGTGTVKGASGFQAMVIVQHALGGLHHMAGFFSLGLIQVSVDLAEHQ